MEEKRLSWKKVLFAPIGKAVITLLGAAAIVVTIGALNGHGIVVFGLG